MKEVNKMKQKKRKENNKASSKTVKQKNRPTKNETVTNKQSILLMTKSNSCLKINADEMGQEPSPNYCLFYTKKFKFKELCNFRQNCLICCCF